LRYLRPLKTGTTTTTVVVSKSTAMKSTVMVRRRVTTTLRHRDDVCTAKVKFGTGTTSRTAAATGATINRGMESRSSSTSRSERAGRPATLTVRPKKCHDVAAVYCSEPRSIEDAAALQTVNIALTKLLRFMLVRS
jgi:hypothetical protein